MLNWEWMIETLNMMAVSLADHQRNTDRSRNAYVDIAHGNYFVQSSIDSALHDVRGARESLIHACGLVEKIREGK